MVFGVKVAVTVMIRGGLAMVKMLSAMYGSDILYFDQSESINLVVEMFVWSEFDGTRIGRLVRWCFGRKS